jgi:hypothetical protein
MNTPATQKPVAAPVAPAKEVKVPTIVENKLTPFIPEADKAKLTKLLATLADRHAKAPKPERAKRGPLTDDQKKARSEKQYSNLEALVKARLAAKKA